MSTEVKIDNDAPVADTIDLSVAHQPIANSTSYVAPYAPQQEAAPAETEAAKAPVVEKAKYDKIIEDVDKFLSVKGVDPKEFRQFRQEPAKPAVAEAPKPAPAPTPGTQPTMEDLIAAISDRVVGKLDQRTKEEREQAQVWNEMTSFNQSVEGFIQSTLGQVPADKQAQVREEMEKAIFAEISEGIELLGGNYNPQTGKVEAGNYPRLQKYLHKSLKSGSFGEKIRPFIVGTDDKKVSAAQSVKTPTVAAGIAQTEKSDEERLMERMKQKTGTPISMLERPR